MNAEERQKWKDNLVKQTEQKVLELQDTTKFKQYLATMAKFHNYSLRNVNLIYAQDPDASEIAGYKQWQNDFDRQVKKGATAIHICAPITRKLTKKEKAEISSEQEYKVVGYRYIPVFDVRQTTGKHVLDVRDFSNKNLKSKKSITKLYRGMIDYLNQNTDFTITESRPADSAADGEIYHKEKKIIINDKNPNSTFKLATLYHEYAHSQLYGQNLKKLKIPVNARENFSEVQAEAVAYVAMMNAGIDVSDYSLGYMATWGHDPKILHQALEGIYKTSNKAIDITEKVKSQIGLDREIVTPVKENEREAIKPKEIQAVKQSSKLSKESVNKLSEDPDIEGLEL